MTRRTTATLAALALSACGCGEGPPKFHAVPGTVRLDGKPLPIGLVEFVVTTDTGTYTDTVECKDGAFRADKVPAGAARVAVRTSVFEMMVRLAGGRARPVKGGSLPQLPEGVTRVDRVPARYEAVDTSGLRFAVPPAAGGLDIELASP